MKICPKCKGENRTSSAYCPKCHNEYQKAWYKRNPLSTSKSYARRKKAIRDHIKEKKKVPCADCKCKYPWYVMDFDHVRGRKKFNLSNAALHMKSIKKIDLEIEKCEVVCANCHRERTFSRLDRS
jgi:RecJ-like exonuclease